MSISASAIAAHCKPVAQQISIRVVAETGSTNSDLLTGLTGFSGPTLLVATSQTAGRGRLGRVWHAAPGASLTFSLAWKFQQSVQTLLGLPLAVGVAVAEALAGFDVFVKLKWPNDVLRDGKKLAGILIETAAADHCISECAVWAVIGVGLNLEVTDGLETKVGREVAGAPWLAQLDRNVLLAAMLSSLSDAMILFASHGFSAFEARWNGLHAYAGMPVVIQDRGRLLHQGYAIGVDKMGRLLLDTLGGCIALAAGDVSLQMHEG